MQNYNSVSTTNIYLVDSVCTTDVWYPYYELSRVTTNTSYDYNYNKMKYETTSSYLNYDLTWNNYFQSYAPAWSPAQPAERLRAIIDQRMAPAIHTRRQPLGTSSDPREIRARQTLRRVIGEQRFRNFLKYGFFTVKAKSGKVYQIFPGHQMVKVWESGKLIESLCVRLNGQFPPTDEAVMRYLLIVNSEDLFRSKANVFKPFQPLQNLDTKQTNQRPLVQIFKELKAA